MRIMRPSISSITASVIGFDRSRSARSLQATSHLSIQAGRDITAAWPDETCALMEPQSAVDVPFLRDLGALRTVDGGRTGVRGARVNRRTASSQARARRVAR